MLGVDELCDVFSDQLLGIVGTKQRQTRGIHEDDPASAMNQNGVGQLIEIAVEKGSKARPGIKLGICGEHGGDPDSVKFCHRAGLSYVSCSPYRVPVARLAAAQAAIEEESHKRKGK